MPSFKTPAVLYTLHAAAQQLSASPTLVEVESSGGTPWETSVGAFIVLGVSFGFAMLVGVFIDSYAKGSEPKIKPGVDAYIDQIVAGNGIRLTSRRLQRER